MEKKKTFAIKKSFKFETDLFVDKLKLEKYSVVSIKIPRNKTNIGFKFIFILSLQACEKCINERFTIRKRCLKFNNRTIS